MKRSIALAVALAFLALGVPAIAGTTGGLNGTVTAADTKAPIAGAKVTVVSPSQAATTVTDASGHFAFVSLAPDEYTISIEKAGFDSGSFPGVAVFADAQQTLSLSLRKALTTIANVTSRSASNLVRSGTTADLYSVNSAQQERVAGLGGGGNLNSAYSAISTVPGAYVPANQSGYNQAVHVRGGDSYEVGYEFDGIPVNRAFDNYPSGSLSSLGQLELQVYTGATPSNAEAQGLAGFINQVIKTGTFPGYANINPTIGTPTFYHSLNVEAGGATPDRLFSYYVGHRRIQSGAPVRRSIRRSRLHRRVRPATRLVSGDADEVASVVLHERPAERRAGRNAGLELDPRADRIRNAQSLRHRDAHVPGQRAHRDSA